MPYASDPLTAKLNQLVASQELYMGLIWFDELNPAEKALIGTWELTNEFYNGGFMQYIHNSSGEHAVPMIEVLRTIDAQDAADILASAVALAGPGTVCGDAPNYVTTLEVTSGDIRDRLSELEMKFFDQSDDMHVRLYRYLARHRDQIEAPEDFWTEATIQ